MWQPCELLYTCYLLTFIQIYHFVVKFSSPQGIDPLTEICGRPWLRRRCCWALRPCRSVFTGRSAANRPQRCRMTGQTDGRKDARPSHTPCCAGIVSNGVGYRVTHSHLFNGRFLCEPESAGCTGIFRQLLQVGTVGNNWPEFFHARCRSKLPDLHNNRGLIITTTMLMVLSSCESSPSSFDECRLSAGWPPTLRQDQASRLAL